MPLSVGHGALYRPSALSAAVRAARPLGKLACHGRLGARDVVHVELFAARRVVVVPAGIGIAPPQQLARATVTGGRCYYPIVTFEPTGVVAVSRGSAATVGDLFALWGEPLSTRRLAGFAGRRVVAFVNGRAAGVDARAIRLTPGSEIVLEIGGQVPPHAAYRFGGA